MNINCYKQITEQYIEKTLEIAKEFYLKNKNLDGIENTFGYFTNHIVAGLNKKRLCIILSLLLYLRDLQKDVKTSIKILDIACGSGLISRTVAGLGFPTIGIDLNSNEIALAKDFLKFFLLIPM